MKVALSLLALLGAAPPVTIPVSDKIPVLNVEALCKASVEDDKANGLSDAQSFSDCVRDEMDAQKQANVMWATSPSEVRNQCEITATTGGSQSYVGLLTCLRAAAIVRSETPAASLKGASQNRNKH
jgi:hypothetical protein